jgi:hypothetical protein
MMMSGGPTTDPADSPSRVMYMALTRFKDMCMIEKAIPKDRDAESCGCVKRSIVAHLD